MILGYPPPKSSIWNHLSRIFHEINHPVFLGYHSRKPYGKSLVAAVRSQLPAVHGQLQPDPFDVWRWDTTLDPSQKMMGCTWWSRIFYKPWWDVQPWWEIVLVFFPAWFDSCHMVESFNHLDITYIRQIRSSQPVDETSVSVRTARTESCSNHDPLQESDFVPPRTRVYMCSWPWLTTASSIGCWWDKTRARLCHQSPSVKMYVVNSWMQRSPRTSGSQVCVESCKTLCATASMRSPWMPSVRSLIGWMVSTNDPWFLLSWFWNFLGERKARKSQKRFLHQSA